MDRFHRIHKLHRLLQGRRVPAARTLIERELECSTATAKRVIEELRNVGAPIEYVRGAGYRYQSDVAFELPGLWFTPSELFALLAAHQLLCSAEPGLLEATLAPLRHRIERLLNAEQLGACDLIRRVRMPRMAGRGIGSCFATILHALASRKRLSVLYHSRQDDTARWRLLSPQRIVHYRDNWYLDAWCHARKALRSFALERIRNAKLREQVSKELDDTVLDTHFTPGYGIFAGALTQTAVLRFSAMRARWVAEELWHPDQQGRWLEDGRFELRVPYSDPRELLMDILKQGDGVEVVAPESLRGAVVQRLKAAGALYARGVTE